QATTLDLLSAFKRVLEQAPREAGQILREELTVEMKIRELRDLLATKGSLAFEELFTSSRRRIDYIVTFLALLELIRLKQIVAMQSETFGHIRIFRLSPEEAAADDVKSEEEVQS